MGPLGWPELTVIAIVVIALFGWKKMPDMARSLGRSARIFKSEVDELKKDGKSDASSATVKGETVAPDASASAAPNPNSDQSERAAAEARLAEAERKAAEARAEAERLRGNA